ncbi:hypothetical protein GCM10011360_22080 [Primorskyibacter flagellatus]|uniref:Uncharacterized protein n=1 Tax=Primorskyibacter flagellatus TaxID=1387277 RepID=A0A917A7Z7_9RHOB|nr:hypothetical protein GCM10011360_22080 [Primorskyibacter flagellatus]
MSAASGTAADFGIGLRIDPVPEGMGAACGAAAPTGFRFDGSRTGCPEGMADAGRGAMAGLGRGAAPAGTDPELSFL